MATKLASPAILLFVCSSTLSQTIHRSPEVPRFMGCEVIIIEPETDADGFFPKGPASICFEGPPQEQCYTATKDFGRTPSVELVQLRKDMPALLFSAASGGVSGWEIHFALLRPGSDKRLENLFLSDTGISNQSEHAIWSDPIVSPSQIFVIADYVPDEAHYGHHRYMISAYILKNSSLVDDPYYYLEDRYMTARSYDYEKAHILSSEKPEIIARLRRLKAGAKH